MIISFSTICERQARKYLWSEAYSFLPEAAKEEAMKHLGEGKLRVQDPMMYPRPQLEIWTQEIFDLIMEKTK